MATARRRKKSSTPRRKNPAPKRSRRRSYAGSRTVVRRVKRRRNPAGLSPTMAAVVAAGAFAVAPFVVSKVQDSISETVNHETSGMILGLGALVGGVLLAKKSPIAAGALAAYGGGIAGLMVSQKMNESPPATSGVQLPGLGGVQLAPELGGYNSTPWDQVDVGEQAFGYGYG